MYAVWELYGSSVRCFLQYRHGLLPSPFLSRVWSVHFAAGTGFVVVATLCWRIVGRWTRVIMLRLTLMCV